MEDSRELELHRAEWAGVKGDGVGGEEYAASQAVVTVATCV